MGVQKMTDEQEILKDILVDESDVVQNLASIIQKAKEIFVMEKDTGKVIFKNYSQLTHPQKICCILIGKYFAKRLKIKNDHTLSISEISNELDIPQTTLSSPLKSLRKTGHILYEKSRYRINPHRIEETVNLFSTSQPKKSSKKRKKTKKQQ